MERSVRTKVFKKIFKRYIFSSRYSTPTIFCWMNKYKIRHASSDYPLIMRIFLYVTEVTSTATVCSSLIPYHPIFFPGKREVMGKVGLRFFWALEATTLNQPHCFPRKELWQDGLCLQLVIVGLRSWDSGQEGVTIRKTWPRAAGEKLSLHIWVTRVWMLPSYLTSTAQFCDDQNLKFNQSMNWTGLALFVIFTPVSSLGCKWKSFIALASGI